MVIPDNNQKSNPTNSSKVRMSESTQDLNFRSCTTMNVDKIGPKVEHIF